MTELIEREEIPKPAPTTPFATPVRHPGLRSEKIGIRSRSIFDFSRCLRWTFRRWAILPICLWLGSCQSAPAERMDPFYAALCDEIAHSTPLSQPELFSRSNLIVPIESLTIYIRHPYNRVLTPELLEPLIQAWRCVGHLYQFEIDVTKAPEDHTVLHQFFHTGGREFTGDTRVGYSNVGFPEGTSSTLVDLPDGKKVRALIIRDETLFFVDISQMTFREPPFRKDRFAPVRCNVAVRSNDVNNFFVSVQQDSVAEIDVPPTRRFLQTAGCLIAGFAIRAHSSWVKEKFGAWEFKYSNSPSMRRSE